ncbi:MAG: hypothetical protein HZA90_23230 [Verrucomicrobia bacterium]|nr:hypothetical protein [Verrucomicrobiota bacterium]
MNSRRVAVWVAAGLVFLGLICMGLRYRIYRVSRLASGDMLWRITYKAKFQAVRAGAKVRLSIPADTAHARVFRQDVLHSGLSAERLRSSRLFARELSLAAGRRGPHALTARFDVHISPEARWPARDAETPATPEARAAFLHATATIPVNDPVVQEALTRLRQDLAPNTNLVERIFRFCAREIQSGDDGAPHDVASALRGKRASPLGRAQTMVALCRAANVPARIVAGFHLGAAQEMPLSFWTEVLAGDRWTPYDPADGFAGALPHNVLPVRRGGVEIVRGSDLAELEISCSIVALPPGPGALRAGHGQPWAMFDLTRLPLEMHETLSVILLLPLGALVTAVFRTVVGIRTFGTFTPTLLALSFVYANWLTGLLTFAVVLTLGLLSRSLLDRLKLLMVPRLSVVLTLVVAWITFTVSVLDYFDLTPSAQAVILPMVILTMTIERFFLTSEEDSPAFALQLLAGTVVVGACCFAVLRWASVGRLVFTYPEVHFFTIAVLVLLGRYSGYRLTELWRFRELAGPRP